MSPTMNPIPIAPLPEPAGVPAPAAGESDSGGAFAQALQRAQTQPRDSTSEEPRAKSTPTGDAARKAARTPDGKAAAPRGEHVPDDTAHTPTDAMAADAAGMLATAEAAADDKSARATASHDDTAAPAWTAITPEVAALPAPAPEGQRSATAAAPVTDSALDTTTIAANVTATGNAAEGRPGLQADAMLQNQIHARIGSHDVRVGPQPHGAMPRPGASEMPDAARAAAAALLAARPERYGTEPVAAADALSAARFTMAERKPVDGASAAPLFAMARGLAPASAFAVDAPVPQATLRAPIDQPTFAPALASQVALWVRDGVQEARLQLHPAELGPVTVQIALDGQAAHVDFVAAVAATRESIEQSLPALAAALRESGFTLAGGGVSGQAAQHGDGQRERAPNGHRGGLPADGNADGAMVPAARPPRWTRSLVDVYA